METLLTLLKVQNKQRELLDQCEARPDVFIRYTYPKLLDESRAAVAKVLNAPIETVVYVPNATSGVNTVLRNLVAHSDGKDDILYFSNIYGACGKTVEYVCEASGDLFSKRLIPLTVPFEDSDVIALFKQAIKESRSERKVPRVAVFDTISSMPGFRVPFEQLTAICREEGILSLVDGAHGIGQVPLDLTALDPDFFISNCHKWLFVPRGCAVMFVAVRNQHLIRSTLPTSHGYVPRPGTAKLAPNPLEEGINSPFINSFEFVGTIDNTNFLVIPEALKWREQVCGGEAAIMNYNIKLAHEAGKLVADILGTKVVDNSTHTMTNCCLVNVLLPLTASTEKIEGTLTVHPDFGFPAVKWMQKTLVEEYGTFMAILFFQDQWLVRLSAQVYLELEDFEWAGHKLKEICAKVTAQDKFQQIRTAGNRT